jgi:broad specificity phosphatase PhoE
MKRASLFFVLLVIAFGGLAQQPPGITTVILVRHAEKADDSKDPQLSDAGRARAQELVRVLGSNRIDAIYTTPYHRTNQTAGPLAEALKLKPQVLTPDAAYAVDLAEKIRKEHAGQTVLVVGHSNSTQNVMNALGVSGAPKIEETTFDNLFVVTFVGDSVPRLLQLRYGAVAR